MKDKEWVATLVATAAVLIPVWVSAAPHIGPMLGLSADFWRGFPIGAILGLQLVGLTVVIKRRRLAS